jgi:hypothetical protein
MSLNPGDECTDKRWCFLVDSEGVKDSRSSTLFWGARQVLGSSFLAKLATDGDGSNPVVPDRSNLSKVCPSVQVYMPAR